MHLLGEFAGRRDDQRQRRAGRGEMIRAGIEGLGEGEAVAYRLAGAGLGGDQEVAPRLGGEDFRLHGGPVPHSRAFVESTRQSGVEGRKGHSGWGIRRDVSALHTASGGAFARKSGTGEGCKRRKAAPQSR